jgi:chaperonin GroES
MRLKGGVARFSPGEWKQHQASGGDIRSSIVPMTFPGPDATMFQMLGMLIEAGREIASVKDVMTGEQPRQQQTATTTLALIEQGMMVFTAAYKRIYRALKDEFRLLAKINAETLGEEKYNAFHDSMAAQQEAMPQDEMMPQGMIPQGMMGHNGGPPFSPQADFSMGDMDIQPVADPRNVTKMQQAAKAQVIMEWSQAGMVDQDEALSRMAESLDIEDVEELLPKVDPMQQQMAQHGAQIQMQMAEADLAMKSAEHRPATTIG